MRITFSLVVLLFFFQTAEAQFKHVKRINECWSAYKDAILSDNGAKAATLVDTNTIQYYDQVIDWVRNADSATVIQLNTLDMMMVLLIRHRSTDEEIRAFTGESLFIYAVNNGMVGKESVKENSISSITIEGNIAKAQLSVSGTPTEMSFTFRKFGRQWKLDLTTVLKDSIDAINTVITNMGITPTEFILAMLLYSNGQPADPDIWQPVK